ncbi:uncharacterized protein LOC132731106 isoform X2 [Ruditapes philippinarum]|nr:uncharacterized protein LOC132731106 isoform X2 [Ruditapes philippinarum]
MIAAKTCIQFLFVVFVYGDRLRELERKMFALQTLTFQDIGMLRESVDRNFEELQRLTVIINASLSQNTRLPNPVQASLPDNSLKNLESKGVYLESEVKRLKRGFKDQKLFFNLWKEDLGTKINGLQATLDDVMKLKDILDLILNNVTVIKDHELSNKEKLSALSEENTNFNESFMLNLRIVRDEIKKLTSGTDALNTCSATINNKSEEIISLFSSAVDFKNVRLVGGPTSSSGRLEVFLNGKWGTVCDDYFNENAAKVACRTLGFSHKGSFAYFGRGSGPILLDNVNCTGAERNLFACTIDYITTDCNHGEDIGVKCLD